MSEARGESQPKHPESHESGVTKLSFDELREAIELAHRTLRWTGMGYVTPHGDGFPVYRAKDKTWRVGTASGTRTDLFRMNNPLAPFVGHGFETEEGLRHAVERAFIEAGFSVVE